jgi:RimJ/RimL family protein N-acetyltransferase
MEKNGMRFQRRLPHKEFIKGRWHDALVYAIEVREWRARQAERTKREPWNRSGTS